MSSRERHFLRRLAERRASTAGSRFGEADPRDPDDRRQAERRTEALTGEALDARLRELGITDRRRGQRRSGGDRRG